jgi:RNA polymerase sigma-70 factor (ECF subfamily)
VLSAAPRPVALPPLRFEDVYAQTFEVVWRTLRRMGVAPSQLDDAAQEVFLVVHRRLTEFEGRSTLLTWVLGIALRVAKSQRRTTERLEHQALDDELPDQRPSPDVALANSETRRLVERLLLELEETRREVFVLFELEQLTAPEISEALGTNLNTVYSRLRLARRDFELAVSRLEARHE